jgi:tetrapyrrole methylase family protein/MazG family protein
MTASASPTYTFPDLLAIMARLRAPGGCPWDREQTHASLLPYLIEEAYEFIDAAESGDAAHMREELGDVLLQVVFHAQVAQEAGTFDIDGVVHTLAEKLVRRHPHVFADAAGVDTADKVTAQWDEIKKTEKAGDADKADAPAPGLLDGIPRGLPPLHKAMKISKKAVKAGFEWPDWRGVAAKVREELAEVEEEAEALTREDGSLKETNGDERDALELELGDLMFSVVNLARRLHLDPERALARTNAKFIARFEAMEALARARGTRLQELPLEAQEALWQQVKREAR